MYNRNSIFHSLLHPGIKQILPFLFSTSDHRSNKGFSIRELISRFLFVSELRTAWSSVYPRAADLHSASTGSGGTAADSSNYYCSSWAASTHTAGEAWSITVQPCNMPAIYGMQFFSCPMRENGLMDISFGVPCFPFMLERTISCQFSLNRN